jgi:hypothetical protein
MLQQRRIRSEYQYFESLIANGRYVINRFCFSPSFIHSFYHSILVLPPFLFSSSFRLPNVPLSDYEWACCIVESSVTSLDPDQPHMSLLIPFLGWFRHGGKRANAASQLTHVDLDPGASDGLRQLPLELRVWSERSVAAGEMVTLDIGCRRNVDLLCSNGYVLRENPCDYLAEAIGNQRVPIMTRFGIPDEQRTLALTYENFAPRQRYVASAHQRLLAMEDLRQLTSEIADKMHAKMRSKKHVIVGSTPGFQNLVQQYLVDRLAMMEAGMEAVKETIKRTLGSASPAAILSPQQPPNAGVDEKEEEEERKRMNAEMEQLMQRREREMNSQTGDVQ